MSSSRLLAILLCVFALSFSARAEVLITSPYDWLNADAVLQAGIIIGGGMPPRASGGGGSSICGIPITTSPTSSDGANAQIPIAIPCFTGSDPNGYSISNFGYYNGPSADTSFAMAIANDQTIGCPGSAPHCPGTTLCSLAFTIPAGPAWTGPYSATSACSAVTLTNSTYYWVEKNTNSYNDPAEGVVSTNCPSTSLGTMFESGVPITSPSFPTATQWLTGTYSGTGTCYLWYATLVAL
jgi:hypothetical protein